MTLKPGTQHGDLVRIPALGLPPLRGGVRGDLVVAALIEIPRKLNSEQEKLLRAYAELEDERVLPHQKGFWEKIKSHVQDGLGLNEEKDD